jgi:S1-C subfamily serine protease
MLSRLILFLGSLCTGAALIAADPKPEPKSADGAAAQAAATVAALVKVSMKALPNARTSAFLGAEREGSGIVIDALGHVLTIGYIVLEADAIEITTAAGRVVPAALAGYDQATGFALLRPTLPLEAQPIPLGESAAVEESDPVLVLPFGGREAASLAFVVSRREFAASWEYLLDSAIFVTPPTTRFAGSALIDREGRLVGVGSLFVRDAAQIEHPVPGNMFVPIDLLKPILAELIAKGRAPGPARPWLGLTTDEIRGHVVVARVSPEGPADAAGLKSGDIIVGVGDAEVTSQAEFYRKVWARGSAGIDVPLKVLQGVAVKDLKLRSVDRLDYLRKKPAY